MLDKGLFTAANINIPVHTYRYHGTESPLDIAVAQCDASLVATLLDAGARPDGIRHNTWSFNRLSYPLIHAVEHNATDIVQLLLSRGDDPSVAFQDGEVVRGKNGTRVSSQIRDMLTYALY
jgi:ankyrin repeat protein